MESMLECTFHIWNQLTDAQNVDIDVVDTRSGASCSCMRVFKYFITFRLILNTCCILPKHEVANTLASVFVMDGVRMKTVIVIIALC
jgi:hypothetical protein